MLADEIALNFAMSVIAGLPSYSKTMGPAVFYDQTYDFHKG